MGDLMAALKADDKDFADSPVAAEQLGELLALIGKGELTGKLAKEIFPKMYSTGDSARVIMEREGLKQIERCRRSREDRRRSDRCESQASRAVQRR